MLTRSIVRTAAFACMFIPAALAPAQTTIERIAPENSVLIVGAKNAQTTLERFKQTGLWNLLQTEKMKEAIDEALKGTVEGFDEMCEELGVEKGSFVAPAGTAGLAVYPAMNEETGMIQIGFVALADYGTEENAQKTDNLIQAAIQKGEKDGSVELDQKDILGRTVYTLDFSKMVQSMKDAIAAMEEEGMDEFGGLPDDAMMPPEKIHYFREGNAYVLSTEIETLNEAVENLDGKGGQAGIDERQDYAAVMEKIGGDNDVYALLLTRDVMDIVSSFDQMGMAQMVQPMIRSVFGKVDGYGLGMRLDSSSAMLEQTYAVYMPEGKVGLTALIDTPSPRQAPPGFAGADAVAYTAINFEFSGFMEFIRKTITTNPMLNMQLGEALPEIEATMKPIFDALGSKIHRVTRVTRPLTDTSVQNVVAFECAKPQEFENAVAELAEQRGMEGRDFLGHRIYSMDPDMMQQMMPMPGMEMSEPVSLGIGGGFVFLGPTPVVEQNLRSSGQEDQGSITRDAGFQRAVAALGEGNVIAWGWSDVVSAFEAQMTQQKLQAEKMIQDIRAEDPEFAEMMADDLAERTKMFDVFDFDLIRQHIGPSAWMMQSVDDGFVGKFYLLPTK